MHLEEPKCQATASSVLRSCTLLLARIHCQMLYQKNDAACADFSGE